MSLDVDGSKLTEQLASGEMLIGRAQRSSTRPMLVYHSMRQQAENAGWREITSQFDLNTMLAAALKEGGSNGRYMDVEFFVGAGRNGQRWSDQLDRLEPLPRMRVKAENWAGR